MVADWWVSLRSFSSKICCSSGCVVGVPLAVGADTCRRRRGGLLSLTVLMTLKESKSVSTEKSL